MGVIVLKITAEMSTRGPDLEKRMAGEPIAGRRGEVSVRMTASDIISLAVNVAQDKWSLGPPTWILRLVESQGRL